MAGIVPVTTAAITTIPTQAAVYAGYIPAVAAAAEAKVINRLISQLNLQHRLEATLLLHQEVLRAEAAVAAALADQAGGDDKRRETANPDKVGTGCET